MAPSKKKKLPVGKKGGKGKVAAKKVVPKKSVSTAISQNKKKTIIVKKKKPTATSVTNKKNKPKPKPKAKTAKKKSGLQKRRRRRYDSDSEDDDETTSEEDEDDDDDDEDYSDDDDEDEDEDVQVISHKQGNLNSASSVPVVKTEHDIVRSALRHAVARLRVGTTAPVGRELQVAQTQNFVLQPDTAVVSNAMQLFGACGTGKTAVVKYVLNTVAPTQCAKNGVALSHIFLNGFLLQKPGELYCRLWQHMSTTRLGKEQLLVPETAAAALEQRFREKGWPSATWKNIENAPSSTSSSSSSTAAAANSWRTIIVVDEVDKLYETTQGVRTFFRLLEWLELPHCHCRLVTMANSMQLPETAKTKSRVSTTSLQRVTFTPYQPDELKAILRDRVSGIEPAVFSDICVETLCKFVAQNTTGDVRKMLQTTAAAIHELVQLPNELPPHLQALHQALLAKQQKEGGGGSAQLMTQKPLTLPMPRSKKDAILDFAHIQAAVRRTLSDHNRQLFEAGKLTKMQQLAICVLLSEIDRVKRDGTNLVTVAQWRNAIVKAIRKYGNQIGMSSLLAFPFPNASSSSSSSSSYSGFDRNQNQNQNQNNSSSSSTNNNNNNNNNDVDSDSLILPDDVWYHIVSSFRDLDLIEVTSPVTLTQQQVNQGGGNDNDSILNNSAIIGRSLWDLSHFSTPSRCHITLYQEQETLTMLSRLHFSQLSCILDDKSGFAIRAGGAGGGFGGRR